MWNSSVWTANIEGGSDPGHFIFTYRGLKDDWDSYYLGWIKIDAAISDGGYPVQLPSDLSGAICIQDGPYLEFYSDSLDFCRTLVESGFYQRTCEYKYLDTTLSIKSKLNCTPCLVCCGVHREDKPCPFLPSPSIDFDTVKHHFEVPGDVIVRNDLATNVINFVLKKHFLLIQAPHCTGKTTLLKNIGLLLLKRSTHTALAIHHSEGQKVSEITLIIAYNTPRLHSPQNLMNHLSSPSRPNGSELWLLIDECQLTYTHRQWWEVLYRKPFYHPDLYVVAVGSFGSHSDPQSHSPPVDVPLAKRMSLFPAMVPNENLFLAFTEAHLECFLWGKNSAIDKQIIMEYASPVSLPDERTRFGVHPGVVSNLVRFLGAQATKYPYKTKVELMDAFCRDSKVIFKCPHPLDIEQCLPHPLSSGFSPIWMLMFSTVLWHGYIEVPILARGIPEVVVENSYGPLDVNHTSPLFFGVLNLNHLLRPPTTNADFACIAPSLRPGYQMVKESKRNNNEKHTSQALTVVSSTPTFLAEVRKYVLESHIARTPRERSELFPSNTSNVYQPGDRSKPYSSRQMVRSLLPLTDFEQAAHDARQLGWLLELPSNSRPTTHCKLVLPSQWHFDYLKQSLVPKTMKLPETISLDEFILTVLKGFNGSYLLDYLTNRGTIRERVYEMAQTADGTGYADFVVQSRKWVIEVLTEGDRMEDHEAWMADTGKYHKEWPHHEKRVVDFRANRKTPKTIKDGYIAVRVVPPGANMGPRRHQRVQMVMCTTSGEAPFTLL